MEIASSRKEGRESRGATKSKMNIHSEAESLEIIASHFLDCDRNSDSRLSKYSAR